MEGERERWREKQESITPRGFFSGEGGEGEERSDRGEGRGDVT